jgi:osmotically-inducible protein OsmY
MQNRKYFVLAASVSVLLAGTSWAQMSKSNSTNRDTTRYQSQMSNDSVYNDSKRSQSRASSSWDSIPKDSVTPLRGLTASDQSNDSADVNITRQIRKEIMANKDMSVNAQNVKIVTIAGKVTLRGKVNSEKEKEAIGKIATNIVRSENVTNELQLK